MRATETLACGLLAVTLCCPAPARAQETASPVVCESSSGEHAAPRRLTLEQSGESGVWLRMDVARCVLRDVSLLPIVRRRVSLLGEKLELREQQLVLLRESVALSRDARESALAALAGAERRARDAERARDAWWRSPALWLAVGAVAAVALQFGAAAALGAR